MTLYASEDLLDLYEKLTLGESGILEGATAPGPLTALLSVPDVLSSVLRRLGRDSASLRRIAQDSYIHENGFRKLLLASTQSGWRLRLNAWPSNRGQHSENIHNHRWDFWSTVIAGTLQSDYYTDDPHGVELSRYRYESLGRGGYSHRLVGQARVSTCLATISQAGAAYHMDHRLLHRVSVPEGVATATLMLHAPPARSFAETLLDQRVEDNSVERQSMTLDCAAETIFSVVDSLI